MVSVAVKAESQGCASKRGPSVAALGVERRYEPRSMRKFSKELSKRTPNLGIPKSLDP